MIKRKKIIALLAVLSVVFLWACDKNKAWKGDTTITGHLYLGDTVTNKLPEALANRQVYINTGDDTSSYVYIVTTNQAGAFSVPSVDGAENFVIYSQFIREGVQYKGVTKIPGNKDQKVIVADIIVFSSYINGLSIAFTDAFGGTIPGLPFRLYRTRTAAVADSVKYAVADSSSNIRGIYEQYNIDPVKYYVVARQVFNTDTLRIFDSLIVAPAGITKATAILK